MENILYFLNKNNYKNFYCKTEDEIVAYGEGEDLVAIKPNFESYLVATYNVTSTTSNTLLLGSSFTLSQITEMYVDDVKLMLLIHINLKQKENILLNCVLNV